MELWKSEDLLAQIYKMNQIPDCEYEKYGISDGLRRANGEGIVVGLTTLGSAYGRENGRACKGKIFYRGMDIEDIILSLKHEICGYEKVMYMLLFGRFPDADQLAGFCDELTAIYEKNNMFLESVIRRNSGHNLMNILASCVLDMYNYDPVPEGIDVGNVLRQSLLIIEALPVLSFNIYRMKYGGENWYIPACKHTIAENIMYILRGGEDYSDLEVQILDRCLVLHAELGGGNNSCFTAQIVSTTGTDSYSAIASAICSLKGPRHGGANIKTYEMIQDLQQNVENWTDEVQVAEYLRRIISGKAFDGAGLIYGIGHAVFTLSDPRAVMFKEMAKALAEEKHRIGEFDLYDKVERLAPDIIRQEKKVEKYYCANVDFYSGFIYAMLDIPTELFTPMFVNGRSAGWCAHRIEEICNAHRIVHPSVPCVAPIVSK